MIRKYNRGYTFHNRYVFFWGTFLSNMTSCKIEFEGKEFNSSEQMFMYQKAILFQDLEIAEIIVREKDPKRAKALGRKVRNFNAEVWNQHKIKLMYETVYQKFNQNSDLRDQLLCPGFRDKTFVEASPFDKVWGIGMHYDNLDCLEEKNWKGQNLLGKVLTDVKNKLLEEYY